ncbi:MAG: hypothetical protein HXY28_05250 [Hydrogenophilaceae bacterium]|nr:hypothetical protein [Hydrogenophilaceae bacterium]
MAITQRHSAFPHLCLVEFSGVVFLKDVEEHLKFRFAHRDLLAADTFCQVREDCHVVDVTAKAIDALRASLRAPLKAAALPMIRRTAWLVFSPAVRAVLIQAMRERTTTDGLYAAPRLVSTPAEAAQWLGADEATLMRLAAEAPIVATFPARAGARAASAG